MDAHMKKVQAHKELMKKLKEGREHKTCQIKENLLRSAESGNTASTNLTGWALDEDKNVIKVVAA